MDSISSVHALHTGTILNARFVIHSVQHDSKVLHRRQERTNGVSARISFLDAPPNDGQFSVFLENTHSGACFKNMRLTVIKGHGRVAHGMLLQTHLAVKWHPTHEPLQDVLSECTRRSVSTHGCIMAGHTADYKGRKRDCLARA